MKKLSIKVKIPEAASFVKSFKDAGYALGEEYQQFDRVFLPRGYESDYSNLDLVPRLIIRTNTIKQKTSHTMILKRIIETNLLYFFQTQVMDYNQTAHIVNNMGYELDAEINKTRRKLVLGSVIIYLDKIDGIDGYFLKIERNLKAHENSSADELWELLGSFKLENIIPTGSYQEIVKNRSYYGQ